MTADADDLGQRLRRKPKQERSRERVEEILRVAKQLIGEKGLDGMTMREVALQTGGPIASVYQYFPNKEALVSALIDRHMEEMNAAILAELTRVAKLPLAEAARGVIELTIKAHAIDPELHRVLTEQVPRIGKLARLRELDEICHRMVAGLLSARKDELAIRDPDLAAFILVSTIEAIVHRAALLYPNKLRDPRLVDEATVLVTRYLGIAEN